MIHLRRAAGPLRTDVSLRLVAGCLLLVLAATVGLIGHYHWPQAAEFAHALSYLALTGVSVLSGAWPYLLVTNVVLGLLWFGVPRGEWNFWQQLVVFANRQVGHLETLFVWATFGLVIWPELAFQVPFVTFVVAVGPLVLDVAVCRFSSATDATELHWMRRIWFYGFSALGTALMLFLARGQLRQVIWLAASIFAGIAIRVVRWWQWRKHERHGEMLASQHLAAEWAARFDWVITWSALAGAVLVPILFLAPARRAASRDATLRAMEFAGSTEPARPAALSVFVLGDSQFHELRGKRKGVHVDMVDAIVPVAVRPVELDLLSGATLAHFAEVYKSLKVPKWIHLGDYADLGCRDEIIRFARFVPRFGAGLAALVAGNHDSTFVGNFAWHPDWDDEVCPSHPVTKAWTNQQLAQLMAQSEAVAVEPLADQALARVGKLGTAAGRDVYGVYLDTADYQASRVGIAGLQGSISSAQQDWLLAHLPASGWVILFEHHPYDELTPFYGKPAVQAIAKRLDGRLLGIVSAHTHLVGHRKHCFAGWEIPEFVIGSTTDPPQEAAVLDVVETGAMPALQLRTLPAVDRKGRSSVKKDECIDLLRTLSDEPACAELFGRSRDTLLQSSQCPEEARNSWPALEPRLVASTPDHVKCLQQDRAWRLLKCIYRDAPESVPRQPLDEDDLFEEWIDPLFEDPVRRDELVCFSWAASILQGHKGDQWGFHEIADMAYETSVAYGARVLYDAAHEGCDPE